MVKWSSRELQFFALERFDERYGCYRLSAREAEASMVSSLRQFGQISPVVCCLREETPCLIDGYKRLVTVHGFCLRCQGTGRISASPGGLTYGQSWRIAGIIGTGAGLGQDSSPVARTANGKRR